MQINMVPARGLLVSNSMASASFQGKFTPFPGVDVLRTKEDSQQRQHPVKGPQFSGMIGTMGGAITGLSLSMGILYSATFNSVIAVMMSNPFTVVPALALGGVLMVAPAMGLSWLGDRLGDLGWAIVSGDRR